MPEPVVYDNTIGTNVLHGPGTVRRDQWRVAWWHWRPEAAGPSTPQRIYDDEAEARQHLEGLQSMIADHELRPCSEHIWRPSLERRTIWESPWTATGPPR